MEAIGPWEFPVGSEQSRAAARNIIATRDAKVRRIELVHNIPRPRHDPLRPHFGQWQSTGDGGLARMVYRPHVWLNPGEPVPTCPDCGTPFVKTSDYPGMAGYSMNCLELHDPDRHSSL